MTARTAGLQQCKPRSCVRFRIAGLFVTAAILNIGADLALAADEGASAPAPVTASTGDASNTALLKKLDAMEQRIKALESKLKQKNAAADVTGAMPSPATPSQGKKGPKPDTAAKPDGSPAATDMPPAQPAAGGAHPAPSPATAPEQAGPTLAKPGPSSPPDTGGDKGIFGLVDSPVHGLSIGAYGEAFFGAVQNPAAGGQWQNSFDARRLVLLPTYAITENIIFNAEIEFEHAGPGFDNDDKLHGTAEIEQVWIDFKISDPINWRAPGIDLVPVGYINQHHEPTEFYSVFRPEIYNGIIPSTWKVPATSVYGTIADGLTYQVMLSLANEDYGDSFDNRTEARTAPPFPTPYFPGIDGLNGLAFSNPPLGDFQQISNAMAVSGRFDITPPFAPGFAGSVSAYYTPNTTPRGAHDDLGNPLGSSSLALFDAEFRYRIPKTWLEFRGEGVYVMLGNPGNLRANNDSDPTDNVGRTMYAASGEVAVHVPMGTILHSEWEAVPFYRYTYENLQTAGFAGTDPNMPTGAGQMQFHNIGVAIFPSPNLVLKATYQKIINKDPAGANSDSLLGAVGFFF